MDIGLGSLTVEFLIRVVGFFGLIFDLDMYIFLLYLYVFFYCKIDFFIIFF